MTARTLFRIVCVIYAIALSLGAVVQAQKGGKTTGPAYDSGKEVKVKGTIEEIRDVPGQWEGTHLVVKSGDKTYLLHLAPGSFLKDIEASFKPGDTVEATGCPAPEDKGDNEILVREITDGNNTATLRDSKGVPVWAGWGPTKN